MVEMTSDAELKRKPFQRKEAVKGALRSYKIKMYPSAEQRRILKQWYAASCRAYNSGVEKTRGTWGRANFIELRKLIVPKAAVSPNDSWVLNVPTKVRARAVKNFTDAQNANITKSKLTGKPFKMQFRSYRKDPVGTIVVEKAFPRDNGPIHSITMSSKPSGCSQKRIASINMAPKGFPCLDKSIQIRDRRWLIDKLVECGKLTEDGKITWHKATNTWHLIVLVDVPFKSTVQIVPETARVVALDPGERSFNTYYSPDGTHGELLTELRGYLREKNKERDAWIGMRERLKQARNNDVRKKNSDRPCSAAHRRSVRHLNRRIARVSLHMQNRRRNGHWDAANFLLKDYDVILVPEFQTQKMVRKEDRVIRPETARTMLSMAHYSFRQCLQSKVDMDTSKMVRLITEPGTSKTCGLCGAWHAKLGGDKIYRCPSCSVELDRDVNGARNNLMAQFTLTNI